MVDFSLSRLWPHAIQCQQEQEGADEKSSEEKTKVELHAVK